MKAKSIKKVIVSAFMISVFCVTSALGATFTIANPIISYRTTTSKIYRTIDISMNATPDACLALDITPWYSERGSSIVKSGNTKGISSYSGRVTQLKGSVYYTDAVDSHRTYVRYEQHGYQLVSGTYENVVNKITYVN